MKLSCQFAIHRSHVRIGTLLLIEFALLQFAEDFFFGRFATALEVPCLVVRHLRWIIAEPGFGNLDPEQFPDLGQLCPIEEIAENAAGIADNPRVNAGDAMLDSFGRIFQFAEFGEKTTEPHLIFPFE